jgi:major type 1 subunit fimbrin (pilin)
MKLSHLTASVAAALVLGFTASSAFAADGTLTFNGQVVASTCSINAGGSGGANTTVTLPTVQASALTTAGQVAGSSQPINIVLSGATCTNGDVYAINFEPSAATVDYTTGALLNTATGGATNVQVQLMDNQFNALNAATNAGSQNEQVTIAGNTGTLTYYAQYLATGAATAGAVDASVEYSIVQL